MAIVQKKIALSGPHKGKTMELHGVKFEDGFAVLTGPATEVEKKFVFMKKCWEVVDADAPDQEPKTEPKLDEVTQKEDPTDPVANNKLLEAVKKLDPENDEHWTKIGKPAVEAVEKFYGSTDIARKDIEGAAPGYDREAARAAAAQQ